MTPHFPTYMPLLTQRPHVLMFKSSSEAPSSVTPPLVLPQPSRTTSLSSHLRTPIDLVCFSENTKSFLPFLLVPWDCWLFKAGLCFCFCFGSTVQHAGSILQGHNRQTRTSKQTNKKSWRVVERSLGRGSSVHKGPQQGRMWPLEGEQVSAGEFGSR